MVIIYNLCYNDLVQLTINVRVMCSLDIPKPLGMAVILALPNDAANSQGIRPNHVGLMR